MYSGTTLRNKSGHIIGVHQKIDRVARRHIEGLLPSWCDFPSTKQILHFEGKNGPDGIKRKSPAVDEPWHYIDPTDPNDVALLDMVDWHIENLSKALTEKNASRASFELAWLAHAITDGLTPPHHYPLEEKLQELRGEGLETRDTIFKKSIMPGDTLLTKAKNNWEYWGAKGAMTTHFAFEIGVATVIPHKRFKEAIPSAEEIDLVDQGGYRKYYYECVQKVAQMNMYKSFIETGWNTKLAWQTNHELMPLIIKAVILGWLNAVKMSEKDES